VDLALGRGSRVPVISLLNRTHAAQVPRFLTGVRPSPQVLSPRGANRGDVGGNDQGAGGRERRGMGGPLTRQDGTGT
jgi:hypothetical protein